MKAAKSKLGSVLDCFTQANTNAGAAASQFVPDKLKSRRTNGGLASLSSSDVIGSKDCAVEAKAESPSLEGVCLNSKLVP